MPIIQTIAVAVLLFVVLFAIARVYRIADDVKAMRELVEREVKLRAKAPRV